MTAKVRIDDPEDGINAWQKRRYLLVRTLLKFNMDVIGCQEVTPSQGAFLIREMKGYSHYPRGKAENNDAATGLAADIEGTFSGLNTLFYRDERLEFMDGANGLILSEELQDRPSENTFYTLCVFRDRAEMVGNLIVINTHLRHDIRFAERCAAKLRAIIQTWQTKYPLAAVIVIGDLNHDKTSRVYAVLTQGGIGKALPGDLVMLDAFDYRLQGKEAWGNWHEFKGKSRRFLPTDLILYTDRLKAAPAEIVRDGGTDGVWPSDHFFVWTGMALR